MQNLSLGSLNTKELTRVPHASDYFLGKKTRRVQGLAAKTPTFVDIMIDDRIVGFAETVLAPVGPSIILNNGEVIDIGPGESAQPMHRDDDAWNFANANKSSHD